MVTKVILVLVLSCVATVEAASIPYYYSAPGAIINVNYCTIANCSQCPTGRYNLNCGGPSNGSCIACPPTPTNSYYAGWGPSPNGIFLTAAPSLCPFECNTNYVKGTTTCSPVGCPALSVSNSQYSAGTVAPSCLVECKPGYTGTPTATNPTACTPTSLPTLTPASNMQYIEGSTSNTSVECKAGYYGNRAVAPTVCTACPAGQTAPSGATTCSPVGCPFLAVSNAMYSSSATYPTCASECKSGYSGTPNPTSCSPSSCGTLLMSNAQFVDGTASPSCNYECKGGYFGEVAVGPGSCTPCSAGSYSIPGSTSCTPCSAGQYQNLASQTTCKNCVYGVNYTTTAGQTTCFPCTLCNTGEYKSGCGGSSAGVCSQCSNPSPW